MWIINCCLVALLFLVPDDSSIFVYIVIDLAIVANGFDLLKKLFGLSKRADWHHNTWNRDESK
jgi:hypothetical protein